MARFGVAFLILIGAVVVYMWGYRIGIEKRFYPNKDLPKLGGVYLGALFVILLCLVAVAAIKVLLWLGLYPG